MLDPSSEMLADQSNLLKIYFYNYEGKIQSCITANPHIVALQQHAVTFGSTQKRMTKGGNLSQHLHTDPEEI